jgi:hypothetical protein
MSRRVVDTDGRLLASRDNLNREKFHRCSATPNGAPSESRSSAVPAG